MPIKRAESKSTAECFRWPSYPLDTAAKTASRLPAKRSAHRAGTQQQNAGMPTTRQEKITSPGQYHRSISPIPCPQHSTADHCTVSKISRLSENRWAESIAANRLPRENTHIDRACPFRLFFRSLATNPCLMISFSSFVAD